MQGSQLQKLARQIQGRARHAVTEEELKIEVIKLLNPFLEEMNIGKAQYERATVLRGRPDAVYGYFYFEYKKPGVLATKQGVEQTAHQLKDYMEASVEGAKDREEALRRMMGVGIDGHRMFFLRFWPAELDYARPLRRRHPALFKAEGARGGFQIIPHTGAMEIDAEALDLLFGYLRSLHRWPLKAEKLAEEFGPRSEPAKEAVQSFYSALRESASAKVDTFFRQWEYTFGIVYGEESGKTERGQWDLAEAYGLGKGVRLKPLLFSVHTYFALLMKLLAAELLVLQEKGFVAPSLLPTLLGTDRGSLQQELEDLESGGYFQRYGVKNFLEGDFFRWYLELWDEKIFSAIRRVIEKLSRFEPATPQLKPEESRDLLKKLYQYLVPKKLRHDLGEYYTPDWLAERLLNQLGYRGNPEERLLDPACGSGTFLTLAIGRAKDYIEERLLGRGAQERKEQAQKIAKNIVGFDLNPLAVIAARTNYLLALGDYISYLLPDLEIPVYMCDSVLTPHLSGKEGQLNLEDNVYRLPTAEGEFEIPTQVIGRGEVVKLAEILGECSRNDYEVKEFWARAEKELESATERTKGKLAALYRKIYGLQKENKNGIWARIIKNSFAPVLEEKFDYVAGNPPWVNWESLSGEWRELSKHLWDEYGLFSLKGHEARLGGGKKDLAMLFTYACMDSYLKPKGTLGFVITQTLFKTKGAGDGFRRFQLGDKEPIRVKHVDDLVELQPFEGASNRTSIIILQKSMPTRYPAPYTLWRKGKSGRVPDDIPLEEVSKEWARLKYLSAQPVAPDRITSPWITAKPKALKALQKVIEKADYQARSGCCTWLNGAYWLRVLDKRPDGMLIIENLHDVGRKKVSKVQAVIEPDLVYPLLRGRDVSRWKAQPSAYLLLAQNPETRNGWEEAMMKERWPKTYDYLKQLEGPLRARSGYKKYFDPGKDPFYAMYNIGPYTLAPYKVGWAREDRWLRASVIWKSEEGKLIMPDQTVQFIPVKDFLEAHYVCSLLNNTIAMLIPRAYTTDITTHILSVTRIVKFDDQNPLHTALAKLSQEAHELAAEGKDEHLKEVEKEIDGKAATLWGITNEELADIKISLGELV